MLPLTTKEKIILFDEKYYRQTDGVVMGSPLGTTLANILVCYHETAWLENGPKSFKPGCYKRYVGDIFVLLFLCHDLLITGIKDTKTLNFRLKLKKKTSFLL